MHIIVVRILLAAILAEKRQSVAIDTSVQPALMCDLQQSGLPPATKGSERGLRGGGGCSRGLQVTQVWPSVALVRTQPHRQWEASIRAL
jgi:hypothetical protein